jgi:protein PhnA
MDRRAPVLVRPASSRLLPPSSAEKRTPSCPAFHPSDAARRFIDETVNNARVIARSQNSASNRSAILSRFHVEQHEGRLMSALPPCPQCHSEFTYEDGGAYICPECAHEWKAQADASAESTAKVYRDSAGNVLQDGDTVTVIKDLKLKGSGGVVKMGTKVKNIRLVDNDHDIDCKIDGFGAMSLKSEFVRKA